MPEEKQLIEPRILKGFQDFLPEEVLGRRAVMDVCESVFRKYGFVPLQTPALEYLDTLLGTGGEETNKELFRLETPEGEPIAMRFDQTVPFARMMAQYPDKLKAPFRRYAIGPVWRGDRPGPGRFREFTQVDIDAAGSQSVAVDAEIVAVVCEIMAKLGADDFCVLVNNRKLIDALLEGCGITDEAKGKHVLRVIDKLEKVGIDNVRAELGEGRVDDSGDPIPGVHLDEKTIDAILSFIAIEGGSRTEVIERMREALPESERASHALDEMMQLDKCLEALEIPVAQARFAPSLARGLDYYTGPVYEIAIAEGRFGSVGGGGRYDELVSRFLDRPIACAGISFGLDRLMAALEFLGITPRVSAQPQVLVAFVGRVPEEELLKVANELRDAGLRTEVYFGKKRGMKHQLSHADLYQIPVAVIVGEDELAKGVVSIKNLLAGKEQREDIDDHDAYRKAGRTAQVTVPRGEMIKTIQEILES
ncbi:MAG: histidine--tRNA ligase [Candidatus Hydrogenedentota bacterium]